MINQNIKIKHRLPFWFVWLNLFFLITSCCSSNKQNEHTAFLTKFADKCKVKLYATRNGMVHDPISLVSHKNHYLDSVEILVSESNGIIKGKDIKFYNYNFNGNLNGTVELSDKKVKVDLYYIDNYYHKLTKFAWNGEYKIMSQSR